MARGSGSDLVADPGWGEMGKHPLGLALIWSCGVPAPFLVSGHHVTRVTKHSLLRKALLLQQQTCSPAQPSAAQPSPGCGTGGVKLKGREEDRELEAPGEGKRGSQRSPQPLL